VLLKSPFFFAEDPSFSSAWVPGAICLCWCISVFSKT